MRLNKRGFSLVELLVVMAIFAVVSTVILELYVNVQRSTVSSEEVVEVQQGMRIALDQVARDIQMAGVIVPTSMPITTAQNNRITLVTASAFGSFARITTLTGTFPVDSSAAISINVDSAAMANLFTENSSFVRIVSPASGVAAVPWVFKIVGVNTPTPPLSSSLRLEPLAGAHSAINFQSGDMIVQVPSPADDATYPNVVTYQLEADLDSADPAMMVLSRIWRLGTTPLTMNEKIIATNMSGRLLSAPFPMKEYGLRFEYLMDDGTVEPAPTAAAGTAVTSALDKIVAVRIYLTGLTTQAKTGGSKVRELQTTVKIRNI